MGLRLIANQSSQLTDAYLMRIALPLTLILALSACSVSEDQEVAIGRQNAEQIEQQLPMLADVEVQQFISSLGQSMAAKTARSDLEWRFRVVDSKQVNAFALPGGFIYVNRGLIEQSDDLSELAGVLGHEIAHVTRRHSAQQMEKAQKTNIGVTVLCTLTSFCESGVAQVAINVGGGLMMAKHSRKHETEADSDAVVNVIAAGIDPRGIPSFFEELMAERERRPAGVESWFSTHPLEESRVRSTREMISDIEPARLRNLTRDAPQFQQVKSRLAALPPSPEPIQRRDLP